MIEYRLHHIEVFRWSEKTGIIKPQEKDSIIQSISIHTFMLEYFSQEIYTRYVNCVKDAIQEAKNIIGYQTISKLSLRHLWNFKFSEMESLREENNKLHNLHYLEFSEEGKLKDTTFDLLSPEDYEVIDYRFFEKGLYKSLSGNEPFARCFMTSEYLYRTIKAGEEYCFDYSSVATGYFKSVELLLYKIMEATLNMKGHEDLWITYEKPSDVKNAPCPDRKEYCHKRKNLYVRFRACHKTEFKIDMGSLQFFIQDNIEGWYDISTKGKRVIDECLKNYNKGCRNQHLHKDIIEDYETLVSVRNNTLSRYL